MIDELSKEKPYYVDLDKNKIIYTNMAIYEGEI